MMAGDECRGRGCSLEMGGAWQGFCHHACPDFLVDLKWRPLAGTGQVGRVATTTLTLKKAGTRMWSDLRARSVAKNVGRRLTNWGKRAARGCRAATLRWNISALTST